MSHEFQRQIQFPVRTQRIEQLRVQSCSRALRSLAESALCGLSLFGLTGCGPIVIGAALSGGGGGGGGGGGTTQVKAVFAFEQPTSLTTQEDGQHAVSVVLDLQGAQTLGAAVRVPFALDAAKTTAEQGLDFDLPPPPMSVTFPSNAGDGAKKTLSITILADHIFEGSAPFEKIGLKISAPEWVSTQGTPGLFTDAAKSAHVVSIKEDDLRTQLLTVNQNGNGGDNDSGWPSVSVDGHLIAFDSRAEDLVPNDDNGFSDVFVRDLRTGVTTRVSVDSSGNQADNDSFSPVLTPDGQRVFFHSKASNLVTGGTGLNWQLYARDLETDTTELISKSTTGGEPNGGSYWPSVSGDGHFVAFESDATNLVGVDGNGKRDIFVRDLINETNELVSVDSSGGNSNGDSFRASISNSGRFVAFESDGTNLVLGDGNGFRDVFMRDRQNPPQTLRISIDSSGNDSDGLSEKPSISANGKIVAFESLAKDLVPGDTNNSRDLFARDTNAHLTTRVSLANDGSQANSYSEAPSVSGNGRFVAFTSYASNLVTPDGSIGDVFLRDLTLHTTIRLSATEQGGEPNNNSFVAKVSPGAEWVAFCSIATNLTSAAVSNVDVYVTSPTTLLPLVYSPSADCDPASLPGRPWIQVAALKAGCEARVEVLGLEAASRVALFGSSFDDTSDRAVRSAAPAALLASGTADAQGRAELAFAIAPGSPPLLELQAIARTLANEVRSTVPTTALVIQPSVVPAPRGTVNPTGAGSQRGSHGTRNRAR